MNKFLKKLPFFGLAVLLVVLVAVTSCGGKSPEKIQEELLKLQSEAIEVALSGDLVRAAEITVRTAQLMAELEKAYARTSNRSSSNRESPVSDFSFALIPDSVDELYGSGLSGNIMITGYSGRGGAVVIPAAIEGIPVKIVDGFYGGEYGLEPSDFITSIVVPNGVVAIGDLGNMSNLTSVTLPDSVQIISYLAFADNKKLTKINLPDNPELFIGTFAFSDCEELTDLVIPASFSSIEFETYRNMSSGHQFSGCGKLPIATRQRLQALGYNGDF